MRKAVLFSGLVALIPLPLCAAQNAATSWTCTMTSRDDGDVGERTLQLGREGNVLTILSGYTPADSRLTIVMDNEIGLIASGGNAEPDNPFHVGSIDHITIAIRHADGFSTLTVGMLANSASNPESMAATGTCAPSGAAPGH